MMYVALLRGINVGGNNTVDMTTLKQIFEKLGYTQVTTYINSGNVIFLANKQSRNLEKEIEKELENTFGFAIRVVVRNFDQMKMVINRIPKKWEAESDWRHNIIFLSHRIDNKENFQTFVPKPTIEDMHYFPGILLWSAKTSDLTHSTMLTINKSKLYKEMTVRNFNTTKKIFEIMQKSHKS